MFSSIDQTTFNALAAQGYNRIPLVLETFADLDTPLSLYLKLANQPYSYLLESVQGGERFGRYSIIGLPAQTRIVVHGSEILVIQNNAVIESADNINPLDFVKQYQTRFSIPPSHLLPNQGLPRFTGGLAGYFGYETIRHIEKRLSQTLKPDAINTPDILLLLSEEIAVIDNLSGKLYFIVYADPSVKNAFELGQQRLSNLLKALRTPVAIPESRPTPATSAQSEFGETAFKAAVLKAQQYILEGDIMQVVLSQRMSQPFSASPLSLYRALRSLIHHLICFITTWVTTMWWALRLKF